VTLSALRNSSAAQGVTISTLLFCLAVCSYGADTRVQVQLDVKQVGPRAVESLTEQRILRDYRQAWVSIAQALEFNTFDPLEGPFVGEAKEQLLETVTEQQHSGLSQRYLDQNHRLAAAFYAPVARYRRVSPAGFRWRKTHHDEHVVVHFVVLMTPGADRWVIRQIQAAPQF
jgi:hypothetical protein